MSSRTRAPAVSDGAVDRRRLLWFVAFLVVVLVAWNNLVVAVLPGYPGSYVIWNLAAAAVLLILARRWIGMSWSELGLDPQRVPAGLRWGGVCFGLVALAYAIVLVVPSLRPLLTDERYDGMSGAHIAYEALVQVPLGNVVWEEIAFRGVLQAALTRLTTLRAATIMQSVLFGLWHIRPALEGLELNDLGNGMLTAMEAVLGTFLVTTAAAFLFTWLRLRSGSLVAPMLLHLATNALGILVAAAAFQLS